MSWSNQYPEILIFLKKSSQVFSKSGNELIIHCPYCDDALRKNASQHGHLYINSESPVFHCFRCETSGFLGTLLRDLGFNDLEIINALGTSLKFTSHNKITNIFKKSSDNIDFYQKNLKYKLGNQADFERFERYVYFRLGNYTNYSFFRMTPEKLKNHLCVSFYNYYNNFTTARIIESTNNFRYIRNNKELYFFQKFDFDQYNNIVLAEGPFDIISLYRYGIFPGKNTFYLAMMGKNYGKIVEWLCSEHLLIGDYNINLIFDNDNKNKNLTLGFTKKIAKRLNSNININGYQPIINNDVGECPLLSKL